MKTHIDQKAGQHHLALVWSKIPEAVRLYFVNKYSIATAEEFVRAVASGLWRPQRISKRRWAEMIHLAETSLPAETLSKCRTHRFRRPPPGAVCQ